MAVTSDMDRLAEIFEVRGVERVREYLDTFPGLFDLILRLHVEVSEQFPKPCRLALEVYDYDDPLLYVIVVCGASRIQADAAFEDLDTNWWWVASEEFADVVGLDMEYGRLDD